MHVGVRWWFWQVQGNPEEDEAVFVVDTKDNPIGWGVFNSKSMYRVRLLAHSSERLSVAPGDIGKWLTRVLGNSE